MSGPESGRSGHPVSALPRRGSRNGAPPFALGFSPGPAPAAGPPPAACRQGAAPGAERGGSGRGGGGCPVPPGSPSPARSALRACPPPAGRQRPCAAPADGTGRDGSGPGPRPGAGRRRGEARLDGRGRGRGRPGLAAGGGGGPERRSAAGARRMAAAAAGSIHTLPALPDDGGSGAFPPGHFKDPKRLYCKNGGFFLRINPDGRVDGVREKSDPHSECPAGRAAPPQRGRRLRANLVQPAAVPGRSHAPGCAYGSSAGVAALGCLHGGGGTRHLCCALAERRFGCFLGVVKSS